MSRVVYRGDSRTNEWRQRQKWKKAVKGCKTLDTFLIVSYFYLTKRIENLNSLRAKQKWSPSADPNLMSDSEIYAQENLETVEEDLAHVFAMEKGLEFVDFCLDYLEKDITSEGLDMELDLEDEAFAVSFHLKSMKQTYQCVGHRLLNRKLITWHENSMRTLPI